MSLQSIFFCCFDSLFVWLLASVFFWLKQRLKAVFEKNKLECIGNAQNHKAKTVLQRQFVFSNWTQKKNSNTHTLSYLVETLAQWCRCLLQTSHISLQHQQQQQRQRQLLLTYANIECNFSLHWQLATRKFHY